MPKISIYIPNDLHRAAQAAGMNLSRICQAAIASAVDGDSALTSTRIRHSLLELHAVADEHERRLAITMAALAEAEVDLTELMPAEPWLRRAASLRPVADDDKGAGVDEA